MSDIHVLDTKAPDKDKRSFVFHYDTPEGDNAAGVPWATCIVEQKGGPDNIESRYYGIDSAELAELKAGTKFEVWDRIKFPDDERTDVAAVAKVRQAYTDTKAEVLAAKEIELDNWGKALAGA